jgi:hypothetical protein
VAIALAVLERDGFAFEGRFRPGATTTEWVARRLLARMHSYSRRSRRESVRTVTAQDFMRFLLRWQHVAPGSQLAGEGGLASVIEQLQGFEAASVAWERELLARRLRHYEPAWLDQLCHQGDVSWLRLTPRARTDADGPAAAPSKATPIAVVFRSDLGWLLVAARLGSDVPEPSVGATAEIIDTLRQRGASFATDLVAATRRLPDDIERGLWDGVSRGLIMCDGFAAIRARVSGSSIGSRPSRAPRPVRGYSATGPLRTALAVRSDLDAARLAGKPRTDPAAAPGSNPPGVPVLDSRVAGAGSIGPPAGPGRPAAGDRAGDPLTDPPAVSDLDAGAAGVGTSAGARAGVPLTDPAAVPARDSGAAGADPPLGARARELLTDPTGARSDSAGADSGRFAVAAHIESTSTARIDRPAAVPAPRPYAGRARFSRLGRMPQPTAASAGRWALVPSADAEPDRDDLAEAVAEQLLRRWGVVFRDLAIQDSLRLPWREIQWALRRLEDRGLVRGGRFVSGFSGEQYALPEAAEQLLHVARSPRTGERVAVNATDPLNLVGVIVPGDVVPAVRTNRVVYVDGLAQTSSASNTAPAAVEPDSDE